MARDAPTRSTFWNSRRLRGVPACVNLDEASRIDLGVARVATGVAVGLTQLRSEIRSGLYTSVLGEDTSGRVPALIAWRAINAWRSGAGLEPVPIAFIQGVRFQPELQPRVVESLTGNRAPLLVRGTAPRTLLVTDIVNSGETLEPIADGLRRLGVGFDVLALDVLGSERGYLRRGAIHADTRMVEAGNQSWHDCRPAVGFSGLEHIKFPDVVAPPGSTWQHMPGPQVVSGAAAHRAVRRARAAIAATSSTLAEAIALP